MREVQEFLAQAHQQDWFQRIGFDQDTFTTTSLGNGLPVYLVFISRR